MATLEGGVHGGAIEAGFQPRLTFGDTLGELQRVRIDGEEPIVGETYRRGTQVDIRAL